MPSDFLRWFVLGVIIGSFSLLVASLPLLEYATAYGR